MRMSPLLLVDDISSDYANPITTASRSQLLGPCLYIDQPCSHVKQLVQQIREECVEQSNQQCTKRIYVAHYINSIVALLSTSNGPI